MPGVRPDTLVLESGVEIPVAYEARKENILEFPVNTGEDRPRDTRTQEYQDDGLVDVIQTKCEGENTIFFVTIKSLVTQFGKDNVVEEEPIEYQNSANGAELYNSVQKDTKSIPIENTEDENEEKAEMSRKDVEFHRKRQSDFDTEASSESPEIAQIKSKQRKKKQLRKRDGTKLLVPKCIQPPEPSESYLEFYRISDEIMMEVQVFRDNGRWGEFYDALDSMSRQYTSPEAKIIILLEKSVAACYENKLEESEKMIKKAIRDAEDTENSSSLIARGSYYRSGVYRRKQNQTGRADSCVQVAEQKLNNTELTLDTTFADYERGSVLMDFLAKTPNNSRSKKLKEEAKTFLKKCIDGSVKLEQDTTTKRYIKKHHFAYIKIALLDLDCRTAAGRNNKVSAADIQEAKDCLDTLKNRYWDGIAQGEKVQYYLAMADLSWRQEDLAKAESFASEAYTMATECGFKTELKPAMERLEVIRNKIQVSGGCIQPQSGVDDDVRSVAQLSDDPQFGDVSSYESDSSLSSPSFDN